MGNITVDLLLDMPDAEEENKFLQTQSDIGVGSPVTARSFIDPRNPVLYGGGLEQTVFEEISKTPASEPTLAERAKKTEQQALPPADVAGLPQLDMPDVDVESVTVDTRGQTKSIREIIDKNKDREFYDPVSDRQITLREMNQGHYFYRELDSLFSQRGNNPLDQNTQKYIKDAAVFLAQQFPKDPTVERVGMALTELPKLPITTANVAFSALDAVGRTFRRGVGNIVNQIGYLSDKDMKEMYGDQSKNPFTLFVDRFKKVDDAVYGDGVFAGHNLRPFVIDLLRREDLELPPDIAAIVLSTKNPDADFISYLTHYLATGFGPAAAVTMIRKGLRNTTYYKMSEFAKTKGIQDISKMDGTSFGKLVDDFVESRSVSKFPLPGVVANAFDNVRGTFARGRIVQSEFQAARMAERKFLQAKAERDSKLTGRKVSVRNVMENRLKPLVENYNKVWSNPKSSKAERLAAKKEMEDMALRNYMGRRFGIYDNITREEAVAEILFASGAAGYDIATKNNNYKGTDNPFSVVAGIGTIIAGQRAVPRSALQLEGYVRETYMNAFIWLKNSSWLAPSAVRAKTEEGAKLRGRRAIETTIQAFPPERRIVLDQTAALQTAPIFANKTNYISGVKESGEIKIAPKNVRRNIMRITSAIKLGGASDNVLDELDKIDKYRTNWGKVTGDPDSFDTSFAAIVALQPLMALQDTTKISLTKMLGGVKIEKLQEHINLAMTSLDILNKAKVGFDNLTPQRLKQIEGDDDLLDFVNGLIEMRRQAESTLGGVIKRIDNELKRLDAQFKDSPKSFKDRDGDISYAAAALDEMEATIQKLRDDAGITVERAGEDARISVAEEQLAAARQGVSELESAVRQQDEDLSVAAVTAETMRDNVTVPRVREDNTNTVVRSYIESGEPEKALFELAMNVRNAKDSFFNAQFANLYKGIEVDIDDSGFIGDIFAKWTEISYGEDLAVTMQKLAKQQVIPSDLRPVVGAIEGASARKLDEYFESLGENGPIARAEIIEQYRNQFGEDAPIYNWLMLNTLKEAGEIKEGLKWNLNDLDLLRRSLNNRASNLDGNRRQELLNLSENINETITSELRRAGGEAAVQKRDALRARYRDEVRGGMYESAIGKLVHEARGRAGGMLNEGELIKRFDLNKTLYGNANEFETFVESLERYFGTAGERVGLQAPKYTLTPNTVVEAGQRKNNIRVGENLQAIFTAMNHSAMLQSSILKNTNLNVNGIAGYNNMADTRNNLYKNITPLNSEAVERLALLDGRADRLGGMFKDVGSEDFKLSLQKLIESSGAVQKAFEKARSEINILASNTRDVQKEIQELGDDAFKITATSMFIDKKITDIEKFMDTYGGVDNALTDDLPRFFDELAQSLKTQDKYKNVKNEELIEQLKEAFYERMIRKVRNDSFGIKTDDSAQVIQDEAFKPEEFTKFVRNNERLIEQLLPKRVRIVSPELKGETLGVLKENYLGLLSDFAESIQFLSAASRQQAPEGIMAYSTKALSPSSWISRIYAVDRNVVSPRYVITEALLVRLRMQAGNDLEAVLRDPELLYYMDSILRTGNVLPKEANSKFNLALRRAIAHNINEGKDPEKTGLDTEEEIQQFGQNIMAFRAGIGGDLAPQTRMPDYTPFE